MPESLNVNEIYASLQGESTWAGLPCIFVRLTGCNLRCSYCDTAYAFAGGQKMSDAEILSEIARLSLPYADSASAGGKLPLIEFTGGEPLLQKNVLPVMKALCDQGYTVLVETSGALDISSVDSRVHRIMDLKCPSSGESHRNRWENIPHLRPGDEIKFVIGTEEDYAWARGKIVELRLAALCPLLFSWVAPLQPEQKDPSLRPIPEGQTPITRLALVERIIADALPVRFQLQMHKFIWAPDERGV